MDPDFKFRSLKVREIEQWLEQHFGELDHPGYPTYRLGDGRKLVFYYATGSDWYSPSFDHLHNQLQPEDLVAFAYTDEQSAHLWIFAVPVQTLLEHITKAELSPTLTNGTKYSLNLEHQGRFRLRQIDLPLETYQIVSQETGLTRGLAGLADPPEEILAQATPMDAERVKRLLRWKLDGCEERGQDYDFVDIRRRLNAIRPELRLLVERPQEFTEASWKTVLDNMHSAQRAKSQILNENDISDVRQELGRFLLEDQVDLSQRFERFQHNLHYVGPSIAGELICWHDPEGFPLENKAAREGLRFFGFDHGQSYASFQTAFADFRQIYERLIGRLQPDLPLNLEIDQLFNQIQKFDLHQEAKDEDGDKEAYWRITLPDQGQRTTVWSICRDKGFAAISFKEEPEDDRQIRKFARIQAGDWIVAFLRGKRIGAIGQVTEPYDPSRVQSIPPAEDYWKGNFRRRIQVTWYPREISVEDLSTPTRNKFYSQTVLELSPAEFQEIRELYADLLPQDEQEELVSSGYTIGDFVQRTYQADERWYNEVLDLLEEKKQIVLYGPPGTGKTFLARELAKAITGLINPPPERYRLVQFHPSYSYEEFIEGIRPESRTVDERRVVEYPIRAGVFKRFCLDAREQDGDCVFVIDEINRGNIASIFGELMYALEYRDDMSPVVLPYSGTNFAIPPNVYIIGTMNSADRSISLMDLALRRRFHFVRCLADPEILRRWIAAKDIRVPYLVPLFRHLLSAIEERDYQIGMSYFMDAALTEERLRRIWKYSIEPYLETYFIDDPQRVEPLRWESPQLRDLRHSHSETANV